MSDTARRLVDTARALLGSGSSGTESIGRHAAIDPAELRAAVEQLLASADPEPSGNGQHSAAVTLAADAVLRGAEDGLAYVAGGGSPSNLTDLQFAGLEAIVHLTGRPAVGYRDNNVQMPPTGLGENDRWRVIVATERSEIDAVSLSVGRLALVRPGAADQPIGTAWRVCTDLVMTNRHVARRIADDPEAAPSTWKLDANRSAIVDFGATEETAGGPRFVVTAIAFCADEDDVDLAVLRLDAAGKRLPSALSIDMSVLSIGRNLHGPQGVTFQGKGVYIVGHPFRDAPSAESLAVFGRASGLKRWSPGLVTKIAEAKPQLEHDCSTLGGNSGSCVFAADGHKVVGVHIGGRGVTAATGRGESNVAIALARLRAHPAAVFLTSPGLCHGLD